MEETLALIKPRAVIAGHTGPIIEKIERAGFRIKQLKKVHLSQKDGEHFYAVHKERPFYGDLTSYIASGPLVALHLEGEGAIEAFRKLIGATDPQKAAEGTLRNLYGESIDYNAVHGSDARSTAAQEITFFFGEKCCKKCHCGA